jgi:hypothetical protein
MARSKFMPRTGGETIRMVLGLWCNDIRVTLRDTDRGGR